MRAIEVDGSALSGLVEVVNLCLTELTAEVHLMCASGPGKIVVYMPCNVISSRRGRDTSRVESSIAGGEPRAAAGWTYDDVRCAWQRRIGDTGVQAKANGTEVSVGIAKHLVEVADACGELVGHRRSK